MIEVQKQAPEQPEPERLFVLAEADGERLDRFLARELDLPRNQAQSWIDEGLIELGLGRKAKASTVLVAGQSILVRRPPPTTDSSIVAEKGALELLFIDDDLLVVDKPAGFSVHPGAGRASGTLVNFLVERFPEILGVGGPGRPGIVHRLDLGTTGALVIARNEPSYRALSRAFAERRVEKRYLAIVWGSPPASGTIDLPIGRHPTDRKRMVARSDGRPATSRYRVAGSNGPIALVEIELLTGRTHQIRVHMKALGHPLVGDEAYGEERWKSLPRQRQIVFRTFPRPALHAWRLAFGHPRSGATISVEAPIPADLKTLWSRVGPTPWPI